MNATGIFSYLYGFMDISLSLLREREKFLLLFEALFFSSENLVNTVKTRCCCVFLNDDAQKYIENYGYFDIKTRT